MWVEAILNCAREHSTNILISIFNTKNAKSKSCWKFVRNLVEQRWRIYKFINDDNNKGNLRKGLRNPLLRKGAYRFCSDPSVHWRPWCWHRQRGAFFSLLISEQCRVPFYALRYAPPPHTTVVIMAAPPPPHDGPWGDRTHTQMVPRNLLYACSDVSLGTPYR